MFPPHFILISLFSSSIIISFSYFSLGRTVFLFYLLYFYFLSFILRIINVWEFLLNWVPPKFFSSCRTEVSERCLTEYEHLNFQVPSPLSFSPSPLRLHFPVPAYVFSLLFLSCSSSNSISCLSSYKSHTLPLILLHQCHVPPLSFMFKDTVALILHRL